MTVENTLPNIEVDTSELLARARIAFINAYAPYSNIRVGAAALFDDGSIITGVNVENASFGLTICAERSAIVSGVTQGKKHLRGLAVTSDRYKPLPPCGACRQVIYEFSKEGTVIVLEEKDGKPIILRMSELLPFAYKFPDLI